MDKTHAFLAAALFVLGSSPGWADELLPPMKPQSVAEAAPETISVPPCAVCCGTQSRWSHWREWLLPRRRAPRCETCYECSRRTHLCDWLRHRSFRGEACTVPCDSPCRCRRFWDWLTYQPHYCPCCCRWSISPCCDPPLYAYFLCTDGSVHYRPCPKCPPPGNMAHVTEEPTPDGPMVLPEKHDPPKMGTTEPKALRP
jgi:hypothetical protein